ncbi:MAG: amidohydrolase family protein [Actinobacteria bacterium]|nr:amidohydrolase family protein [Actinomycetota bacterium]
MPVPTHRPLVVRGPLAQPDGPTAADGTVLLEEGRVRYAGPATDAPKAPDHALELEVEGTIVPGLIDAHVHLTCDGGPDLLAEVDGRGPAELTAKALANAWRSLARGVVAVRDLGAPCGEAVAVANAVRSGRLRGPEVAAAGRALTAPGGHIPYLGRVEQGVDAMARAATEELAAGAVGIKLIATGGVLTRGVPIGNVAYDEDELAAASRVAREAGAWVAAHVIGLEGTKRAVRAGATTIEHATFVDDEAVDLIRDRGVVTVGTLSALHAIVRHGRAGGVPEESVLKAESVLDVHTDSLRRVADAGLPLATGTDAGTPFNPHGGVATEARLLVQEIGVPPAAAFRAATVDAARCLLRDDLGRLVPGGPGHLVVVDGDPRDDVTALERVRAVVWGGLPIDVGLANLLPLS